MNIFGKKKQPTAPITTTIERPDESSKLILASMVLNSIAEGVIILNEQNLIKMINPAASSLIGFSDPDDAIGLDFSSVVKFDNGQNLEIPETENKMLLAIKSNNEIKIRDYTIITAQDQRRPVEISLIPSGQSHVEKIITIRDITKELEEESEQAEFISTASHEMRTPVASIEGYLGLALNPQTATIDERARKYLEEAHKSSKHLGRLFQDLLDTTKLDDNKIRLRMTPVEMVGLVKSIADGQLPMMQQKNIKYTFGATDQGTEKTRRMEQLVYGSVDVDFLREIVNNLIENAIKYTAEGGSIWVNVRGDGDRILINVTDTGIGISPDDLKHIFQKFYRVDNSQTRTIGGTGLGLYLVKQRVESMGGKVWANSSFGEGSTFFLTFPRLTQEEYERRKQVQANQEAMGQMALTMTREAEQQPNPVSSQLTSHLESQTQPESSIKTQSTSLTQTQLTSSTQVQLISPAQTQLASSTQTQPDSSTQVVKPTPPKETQPTSIKEVQPPPQPTSSATLVAQVRPSAQLVNLNQPQTEPVASQNIVSQIQDPMTQNIAPQVQGSTVQNIASQVQKQTDVVQVTPTQPQGQITSQATTLQPQPSTPQPPPLQSQGQSPTSQHLDSQTLNTSQ